MVVVTAQKKRGRKKNIERRRKTKGNQSHEYANYKSDQKKKAHTLVLGLGHANQRGVIDESVLGRVVLGLERAEQGLLGAENLHGGRGVLERGAM